MYNTEERMNEQSVKNLFRAFPELKKFDPIKEYPKTATSNVLNESRKNTEVSKLTRLLVEMQAMHAPNKEQVRAYKYLMVVTADISLGLDWMEARRDLKMHELFMKYLYAERSFS